MEAITTQKELAVAVLAVIGALATAVAGVLNKLRAYKIEKNKRR